MNGSRVKYAVVNHLDGQYRNMIAGDIIAGLSAGQRYIPSKYFYDAQGSKLFEDICRLPEYYPTRTEMAILKKITPGLMEGFANRDLVELGAGSNWKIRILLEAAGESGRATLRYIPVDISQTAVIEATKGLAEDYPELETFGVVADFTSQLAYLPNHRARMYCFLGGTIGNMGNEESINFLHEIARNMNLGDTLLIGFDMMKPPGILETAYNDSRGITGQFNRNILNVINNELNANFDQSHFDHIAFFNEDSSRIEMHLQVNRDCSVRIDGIDMQVNFDKGETIHTENSHKFTREMIERMAGQSGLSVQNWYSDSRGWFSLVLMGLKEPLW